MIDREFQEVRVYTIGIDLQKDEVPPLPATPFATVDGELITFGDLFHEMMVKSGRAENKSYMDYDKDLLHMIKLTYYSEILDRK